MSISRAQAEALRDGFIDSLGRKPPEGELPIIDAMLGLAAQSFIDAASANLDRADAVDTGDLQRDLRFEVETNAGTYLLSVGYEQGSDSAKYYDYTNKGVRGVKKGGKAPGSPYKFRFLGVSKKHQYAMEQWVRRSGMSARNISPKHPVSGLEKKRASARVAKQENPTARLAYAMARNSKKEGLKPTHYFDDAVSSTFGPDFIKAMEIALGGEVIIRIKQEGLK